MENNNNEKENRQIDYSDNQLKEVLGGILFMIIAAVAMYFLSKYI